MSFRDEHIFQYPWSSANNWPSLLFSFPFVSYFDFLSTLFLFCTKKIEARKTEITTFLHCSPDSPYGKGKIETIPVSPKVVPAVRHIHNFCSVFLKRVWSPHRTHRQKMWVTIPDSWAPVIISEVMLAKWNCGPLLIAKVFEVPCKTSSKVPKNYFNPHCLPFLLPITAMCHLLHWCLAQCCWEPLLSPWSSRALSPWWKSKQTAFRNTWTVQLFASHGRGRCKEC